jgi:two-component system, LuxR family, sensor kinase FixL
MQLQSSEQLAQFFALSLDLFCVANSEGYFTMLNDAWESTLGYSKQELKDRPYIEFVHPEDANATIREQENLGGGLSTLRFENRYLAKDGSWKWLSWNAVPQVDGTVYAVARDITSQKEDQKATELLLLKLEQGNRELDEFAYIVSHDLKSPLRGILNLADWIREDLGDDLMPEVVEHISMLQTRVQRMQRLIEDLLQYAKMGKSSQRLEKVDLNQLIDELCNTLVKPSGFQIMVPKPLLPILARPSEVFQLFQNLLSNAIKYRSHDAGKVIITQVSEKELWRFHVQDDGIGIESKHHARIFQVFQRLNSADEIEGTGIGLALVKKIVEGMGGSVDLTSELGQGSTFSFTWPK